MKIAIVGSGTMGEIYARNLAKIENLDVVSVYSRSLESARQIADLCGAKPYDSIEQMMEQTDPEVVCITLPTFLHKEYVLKLAGQGKHIICEKPLALNTADAVDMIRACDQAGVRLFVGHVLRFYPDYIDIQKKVASGVIGNVGVAHLKRAGSHPGLAKAWYYDQSLSGGVIMDLLIHDLDFARAVLGEVNSVFAQYSKAQGIDHALVTLRFHSGAIANLQGFWGYSGPFTAETEFAGSKGIIRTSNLRTKSLNMVYSAENENSDGAPRVVVDESPSAISPFQLQLSHFLSCIRSGEDALVTARDALKAVEIAQAANESARIAKPIRLGN